MKTEEFDKKLQKKLLELNSEVSEEEINKLHDFVRSGKRSRWKRYRLFYLLGFLFIVSAGTVTISIRQWRTIKTMTGANAELAQQVKELKAGTIAERSDLPLREKATDGRMHNAPSSAKVMHMPSDHQSGGSENPVVTDQKKEKPSVATTGSAQRNDPMTPGENRIASPPAAEHNVSPGVITPDAAASAGSSTFASTSAASSLPAHSATSAVASVQSPTALANSNPPDATSSSARSALPTEPVPAVAGRAEDTVAVAERSEPVPLSESNNNPGQNLEKNDSVSSLTTTVSSMFADTNTLVKNEREKPAVRLLKYRVGLNSELASRQLAAGIIGEVIFNKHWSVSAGLKYMVLDNEKFSDEEDYHHKKGKDFKEEHPGGLNDTVQASNIHLSYNLFQVPFSLNYSLPLKKSFSLLFSLGTDLDVYARKDVDYDARNRSASDATHQSSTSKIPALAFNNMVIAVAAEKQWSRFAVQISPFLSPQLKKTEYKNERLYYGLKLRLFYTLR